MPRSVTRPSMLSMVMSTPSVASCARNAARTRADSAMPCSSARDASVSANSGRASRPLIICTQVSTDSRSVLSTMSNSTGSFQVTPNWSCMRVALAWSLRRISASATPRSSVSICSISQSHALVEGPHDADAGHMRHRSQAAASRPSRG